MISAGPLPMLGPCMVITLPVGGPCPMHAHEGPGACPECSAEIARLNAAMRIPSPFLPVMPPVPWSPRPWYTEQAPLYVGTPLPNEMPITICGPRT